MILPDYSALQKLSSSCERRLLLLAQCMHRRWVALGGCRSADYKLAGVDSDAFCGVICLVNAHLSTNVPPSATVEEVDET